MEAGKAVSITIPKRQEFAPFKIGDKVRLKKSNEIMFPARIRNKRMVYRLLRKEFKPTFIINNVFSAAPNQFNANMQPYNFQPPCQ